MMKKLISCLLLISALNIGFITAQDLLGKVSPETADFMKYGFVPVSLYEGKINYSIPIYSIEDEDFKLPLSVIYTSDGFRPSKHSGLTGLGWFLNQGGVITKEVYGAPDDVAGVSSSSQFPEGMWWATQTKKYDKEKLYDLDSDFLKPTANILYDLPTVKGCHYDAQPDLFMFSFCGHKGQFMIDSQRKIITNQAGYKIDLSGLSKQYTTNKEPTPSVIKITAPDGYQYVFGTSSNLSAIEFSKSFKQGTGTSDLKNPTILAWHLTKITAPNGRYLEIEYLHSPTLGVHSPQWHTIKTPVPSKNGNHSSVDSYSWTAIKEVIPTTISIPDTKVKIEFITSQESSQDTSPFYQGFSEFNPLALKLDQIKVFYNGIQRYKYDFSYEYKNRRRFLSKVVLPGKAVYKLTYIHKNYPEPETQDIDLWGYWKYNDGTEGLLSKIQYPTGGYSHFTYESNTYTKRVEVHLQQNSSNYKPELKEKTGTTGGIRIKEIRNITKTGKTENTKKILLCQ